MSDEKPTGGPDDSAKPNSEDAKAPKLTDLLAEWEKGEEKPKLAAKPDELTDRLSAIETRLADDAYKTEMTSVVAQLKGDLDVDDFVVEAWINKRADEDSRLRDLYTNRDEKKTEWGQAIQALAPEFQKYVKERIAAPASDKKLGAAVRAAQTQDGKTSLEGDVNYGTLSDADFALKKAEVFRLAESGQLK